jgi:hypothetical protein
LSSASEDHEADHHLGAAGSASINRGLLTDNPPDYHEDEALGGMEEDTVFGGVALHHEPTWNFPNPSSDRASDTTNLGGDGDDDDDDDDDDAGSQLYKSSYQPYSSFQTNGFDASGHPSSPAEELDDVPPLAHQSQNSEYEPIETIETDDPAVQEIILDDNEESHLKSD